MAVRTADFPDPFSPDRKVILWFGLKVNVHMEPRAGGQVRDDGLDDGDDHARGAEQG